MGNSGSANRDTPHSPRLPITYSASCKRNEKTATYQAIYTFSERASFIKITQSEFSKTIYPDRLFSNIQDIDINITRSKTVENQIKIVGILEKAIYQYVDKSYPNQKAWNDCHSPWGTDFFRQEGKTWLPWWNDGETEHYGDTEQNKSYRGGNRLYVQLRNPGKYNIIVPEDCDVLLNTNKQKLFDRGSYSTNNNITFNAMYLDNKTEVAYKGRYDFSKPNGYVKITTSTKPTNINVKRTNETNYKIILEAIITKSTLKTDEINPNNLPWSDDTQTNTTEGSSLNAFVRGGNRINIVLNESGTYNLIIPDGYDLTINIDEGDMQITGRTGRMEIGASWVSRCGYTGSSVDGYESWSYEGNHEMGISRLKTKTGKAFV